MNSNTKIINSGKIAVGDLGNSRIKIMFADEDESYPFLYSTNWHKKVISYLEKKDIDIFLYSSVNSIKEVLLLTSANKAKIKIIDSSELLPLYKSIDFTNIENMGNDRAMGLIAGLSMAEPPFITIDAGSAVTINVVDESRKCLGGTIFPNIYLQELALKNFTSGLKNINFKEPKTIIGTNTNDAISSGIRCCVVGGIKYILTKIIKDSKFSKNIPIFLTGGNADFIKTELESDFNILFDENLVLKGILTISDLIN